MTDLKMEWGKWTNIGTNWVTKTFHNTYSDPIIVISCLYDYTSTSENTIVAEVKSVTSASCQVRMRVVSQYGSNTDPPSCDIHYIICENTGTNPNYVIPGTSLKIQAGKFSDTDIDKKNSWTVDENITFYPAFSGTIVGFASRVTHNESGFATTWICESENQKNPLSSSDSGCHIHFNAAEVGTNDFTTAETINYIIVEQGTGTISGSNGSYFQITLSGDTISGLDNSINGYDISLSGFSSPEVAICMQQAMDGGDGSWAHVKSISSSAIKVWALEDQTDSERSHTTEQAAAFVFENSGHYNLKKIKKNIKVICH